MDSKPDCFKIPSIVAIFVIQLALLSNHAVYLMEAADPILYYVTEEGNPGKLIGNIITDTQLNQTYPAESLREMTFVVLDDPEGFHEYVEVSRNGDVRTTRTVDRERFCQELARCVRILDVETRPSMYFMIIKIQVEVLDINDNIPVFEDPEISLVIPESIFVGSMLPLPLATDSDSPVMGIQEYQLINPVLDTFRLAVDRNPEGIVEGLYLEVVEPLDRELQDQYILYLNALEVSRESNSSSLLINITVTDVNDNSPDFTEDVYHVTVTEDFPLGPVLQTISASDPDEGSNAEVTYSFSRRTQDRYGGTFVIDMYSGEISLKRHLDYEDVNQYSLVVQAMDGLPGNDVMTSDATVIVTVEDINDNAPRLLVTSMTSRPGYDVTVSESADLATPVAHITISDLDTGESGLVTCYVDHDLFTLSRIYDTDLILQTASILDRETTSLHDVTIYCRDGGAPSMSTESTIQVYVLDENDNAPQFEYERYAVTLSKTVSPDDVLVTVEALDADEGPNAEVRYTILDPFLSNLFTLGEMNGELRLNIDLDASVLQGRGFSFIVMATDGLLSGYTLVVMNATHVPHDTENTLLELAIPENSPSGTILQEISSEANPDLATSGAADCGNLAAFILQDEVRSMFNVVSLPTGWPSIMANVIFDREVQSLYKFTLVSVWTCGNETQEDIIRIIPVSVHILDQNDHAPEIHFPREGNDTIILNQADVENLNGSAIAKVKATDLDEGPNGLLSYRISSDTISAVISIHENSGEVFLEANWADIGEVITDENVLDITILVQDHGTPSLKSAARLLIFCNRTETPVVAAPTTPMERNLTMVLAVALPCGFLLVITAVVLAVMLRRAALKHKKEKHAQTPKSPQEGDLEQGNSDLAIPSDDPDKNQHKLWSSCQLIFDSLKTEDGDLEQGSGESGHSSPVPTVADKQAVAGGSPSGMEVVSSSRDSDSGCSTDMSHITYDSWGNAHNALQPLTLLPWNLRRHESDQQHISTSQRGEDPVSVHQRAQWSGIQRCGSYHCGPPNTLHSPDGATIGTANTGGVMMNPALRQHISQPRSSSFDGARGLPHHESTKGVTADGHSERLPEADSRCSQQDRGALDLAPQEPVMNSEPCLLTRTYDTKRVVHEVQV